MEALDKIQSLKQYITQKIDEDLSGGIWEYCIGHEILESINRLNKTESALFSTEILSWEEDIIYNLADEIIFGDNDFLEKDYLYCLIFLKMTDQDNIDYLLDNLYACYNCVDHETKPLDFYLDMRQKLKSVWSLADDDNYFIKALDEMIVKKCLNQV